MYAESDLVWQIAQKLKRTTPVQFFNFEPLILRVRYCLFTRVFICFISLYQFMDCFIT